MTSPNKILVYTFAASLVIAAFFIIKGVVEKQNYERQLTSLRNEAAASAKTIEVQKGVYEKLTLQNSNMKILLDEKDSQLKLLTGELKKKNEQILVVTSVSVKWKKAYEAVIKGTQSETDGRKKVEFAKDFGYIGVNGYTLTDPPEAWVRVQQNRPLRLSVVVSQDKDKVWKTRVTSSEENVEIDMTLAAVNPLILEPKWYEGIGVGIDVGVGNGFIGGVGATYKIGKFELGPKAWMTATDKVEKFFGAQFLWHPFQR
jgi:hypothetical protein